MRGKSEIPISKSETNSKSESPKSETKALSGFGFSFLVI
jgi:hypothetical protein